MGGGTAYRSKVKSQSSRVSLHLLAAKFCAITLGLLQNCLHNCLQSEPLQQQRTETSLDASEPCRERNKHRPHLQEYRKASQRRGRSSAVPSSKTPSQRIPARPASGKVPPQYTTPALHATIFSHAPTSSCPTTCNTFPNLYCQDPGSASSKAVRGPDLPLLFERNSMEFAGAEPTIDIALHHHHHYHHHHHHHHHQPPPPPSWPHHHDHVITTSPPQHHHIITTSSPHHHHAITTSSPRHHHIITTSSTASSPHHHYHHHHHHHHQAFFIRHSLVIIYTFYHELFVMRHSPRYGLVILSSAGIESKICHCQMFTALCICSVISGMLRWRTSPYVQSLFGASRHAFPEVVQVNCRPSAWHRLDIRMARNTSSKEGSGEHIYR